MLYSAKPLAAGLAVLWLAGCTYSATAPVKPAYNVYSNYDDRIPGNFALYIDAEAIRGEFSVDGYHCSAHTYPLDATTAFKQSALLTIRNLVEEVVEVPQPLDRGALQAGGYAGLIQIKGEDIEVRLLTISGFWSSSMDAEVEVSGSIRVDGPEGRALGTTVEGDERAKSDAGTACEGGATAISLAASDAIKEVMERMGERLTNSTRVRELEKARQAAPTASL